MVETVAKFESLRIDRSDGGAVAEVTLARPDLLNRMDDLGHRELVEAFRGFEGDATTRAIVFAAEGKVFSAGGDFDLMLAGNADLATRRRMVGDGYRLIQAMLEIDVPIVVALHGDAVGLGATVVLASDMVVSHPGVRLSDPHVPIGLVAGDGGCIVWPESTGMLRAKRHLLTGDAMSGSEAYLAGLVTDLADTQAQVLPDARALARRIAELPPLAVQGTKRALNDVLRHRFAEVMAIGLAHEETTLGSEDLREAIAAFRERRSPTFHGR